jgi:uncharacterized cupredoxin-like copper-binding protein
MRRLLSAARMGETAIDTGATMMKRATMMKNGLRAAAVSVLLIAGLVAAGCGGDDSATSTEAQTTGGDQGGAATVGGEAVRIAMGEFFFDPENASAKAGSTTISAPNEGSVEHELVLSKTNLDPAGLPTSSNGEVDEEKLGAVGEIAGVKPGETGEASFDLEPGTYVMFCNLPAHYAQGMYGTLTVTK